MSRVGRDYLQTGYYTEVFFREKGIRFIAVEPLWSSEVEPFPIRVTSKRLPKVKHLERRNRYTPR